MDRSKEAKLLNLAAEQPPETIDYRAPEDMFALVFSCGTAVEKFTRFFIKTALLDIMEAEEKKSGILPLHLFNNALVVDYNYFVLVIGKWINNNAVFADFALRQHNETGSKGNNDSRGFALVTGLSHIYKLLSPQTLLRAFIPTSKTILQTFYQALIYASENDAVQFASICISDFYLQEIFPAESIDSPLYLELMKKVSNSKMEQVAYRSKQCKDYWRKAGKQVKYYA
ncbi:hypothetical protein FACS1894103_4870 [Campylobacterota bacterium]|nr:hypothetical protein FACS1894103_4870 [Campylobacterota bacterium]